MPVRRSVQRDPTLIDGHDEGEEGAALLFGFDESHEFGEIDTAVAPAADARRPCGRVHPRWRGPCAGDQRFARHGNRLPYALWEPRGRRLRSSAAPKR